MNGSDIALIVMVAVLLVLVSTALGVHLSYMQSIANQIQEQRDFVLNAPQKLTNIENDVATLVGRLSPS